MSKFDFQNGFVRSFGGKNKSLERVGLDAIDDTPSFRTAHLPDGGLLRTKGGFPQVTYEPESSRKTYGTPLHGRIDNMMLTVYDDLTDAPSGDMARLNQSWYTTPTPFVYEVGHTTFVANVDLTTDPTYIVGQTNSVLGAIVNGLPGTSTMWGDQHYNTHKGAVPLGTMRWLFQSPGGRKYRITLTIDYTYSYGIWIIYRGDTVNFTATLTAEYITPEQVFAPVTILDHEAFTVTNTLTPELPVAAGPYSRPIQFDCGAIDPNRSNTNYTQLFDGLCPSPTGNEAFFNFMVTGGLVSCRWSAKVLKFVISESAVNSCSATMTVDLDESQCYKLLREDYSTLAVPTWLPVGWVDSGDNVHFSYVLPPGEGTYVENYWMEVEVVNVRSYEPNNSSTCVPVTLSTRRLYQDYYDFIDITHTASGSFSDEQIVSWSFSESVSSDSQRTWKETIALIHNGDEAARWDYVIYDNERSWVTEGYSCAGYYDKNDANNASDSGTYAASGGSSGGWQGGKLTVGGVETLRWSRTDTHYGTDSVGLSYYPAGVDGSGKPAPILYGRPELNVPRPGPSGVGFFVENYNLVTNNVLCFDVLATTLSDTAPYQLPPGANADDRMFVCVAAGSYKGAPAAKSSPWLSGTGKSISWNPRRPQLWAFSRTALVAWV